jgi:hypothetical protein
LGTKIKTERWEKLTGDGFVGLDGHWVQENPKDKTTGGKLQATSGEAFPYFCLS